MAMKTRDEWGEGPWQNEPDGEQWVDEDTGLRCRVLRNKEIGTWCGYVGVPKDHDAYGMAAADLEINVHGGLTFSGYWKGDEAGQWWLGFDCAHASDYLPAFPHLADPQQYKTIQFARRQCSLLAKQLREIGWDEDMALEEIPL